MISASEWKAYNDGVSRISDAAEKETERRLLAWHALNPDATVAESREFAKEVMAAVVQSYDGMAASFAAEWYDYRAEKSAARLDQAVTSAAYSPETDDEVARYQAKKLAKGDFEGFAKACGEYARNDALRSLNETIMANAKRDRRKGVRFARVPTGLETCTFCLMLAGRGAVYHTRKTAGEFRHFHRRCDCKVVPGFEDNPDAELVEGHSPVVYRRWYKRISASKSTLKRVYENTEAISEERTELELGLNDAWAAHLEAGGSERSYREHYASFIELLVPGNPISVEDFVKLEGKELHEAIWLAATGHTVCFRNPDKHKREDGNTSDVLVDGVTCDLKCIQSSSLPKMAKRVTEKLDRQGPKFLIDLSQSGIEADAAAIRLSKLCDDEKIEGFFLVSGGFLREIKK